jgi:hypothetical protein
MSVKCPT